MQKHPSRKLDKEFKVRRAIELLNSYQHKHEIFAVMEEEFGIKWRQSEEYLRLARERMLAETQKDKQEHVCDSFSFYKSIVEDPKVRPVDRIRAQEQIDRLLGLQQPQKVAPTTPDGEGSWTPETTEQLRAKVFERLTQLGQPSRQ